MGELNAGSGQGAPDAADAKRRLLGQEGGVVSRTVAVTVLGLIWLATSPFCFSQTRQARDRQLEEALADITLLKRVVNEQDRRIADLEKKVKTLHDQFIQQVTGGDVPWLNPSAWGRVKAGMSRTQVEQILGPPTSVDSVLTYQTRVYKAYVAGVGTLTGTVLIESDRVSEVSPPEF